MHVWYTAFGVNVHIEHELSCRVPCWDWGGMVGAAILLFFDCRTERAACPPHVCTDSWRARK